MCVYECCMAQLSHPPVLYIIGPTVDPSGCAQQTVDFHYRRTLSLYNSTRSTSVQGDHFHSVYFAAGKEAHSPPAESECIPVAVVEEQTFCRTFFYSSFNDGGYTSTVWH